MTRQLFNRYLQDRCTAAEGREAEQWLRHCTEQELDDLLLQSWEENPAPMPEQQAHALWRRLHASVAPPRRARRIDISVAIRWTGAAAASVLLLLLAGKWLSHPLPAPAPLVATTLPAPVSAPQAAANDWVRISNNDQPQMPVKLADGTQVILSRYSGLRFQRNFLPARRDVYLEGKALFAVAKDRRRPFTVFSGDISTTALGTVFRVNAGAHQSYISVRLLEGRILVRLIKQAGERAKDSLFLRPGDELRYDIRNRTAQVQSPACNTTASIKDDKDGLSFTRAPLSDVFEKLMLQYHVTISYNKADITAMNFTGTITTRDSMAVVLKVITQMNGLTATEKEGAFVIGPARP
ncbi:MAG TPA: FecR domain-containing protein [Chitinophagaceae bacterium]|nr:FecR domain-containing protein [Chitinophagaceae bacterium]